MWKFFAICALALLPCAGLAGGFFSGNATFFMACCTAPSWSAGSSLQIVGTGGGFPLDTVDVTTQTKMIVRAPVVIAHETQSIVLSFTNGSIAADGSFTANPDSVTIEVCLEQQNPAKSVRVTFGGSNTKLLASGDNDIQSDEILPSAFGLSYFSRDTVYFQRVTALLGGAGSFPVGTQTANVFSGGDNAGRTYIYPPASENSQLCNTGSITALSDGTSQSVGFGATAVLGKFYNPAGVRSVWNIGDSTMVSGDGGPYPFGARGYERRAAFDGTVSTNTIAMATATRSGISAGEIITNSEVITYCRYANILHTGLGANDLNNGGSAAESYSNLSAVWTACRNLGVQKIVQGKLMPRTTSTNSWMDSAGQTYSGARWSPGGDGAQLNALLAAAVGGDIAALSNYTPVIADPSDPFKWISNGAAEYATVDGTHPSTVSHEAMGEIYRSSLLGVTVNYLLGRDLGAANDNSPVWLDKAA